MERVLCIIEMECLNYETIYLWLEMKINVFMASEELIDYLENGNIRNSVNYPNLSMNCTDTKICVIHKNVPTTIASITSAVGNEGINIENMVNASKKDFAYTMLDVIGDIPASVEGKINAIDGVIRVRIINK